MWCKKCERESNFEKCEICGETVEAEIPVLIYWCSECKVPVIKNVNDVDKSCNICKSNLEYMSTDIRPVFPEERLLLEILIDNPLAFKKKSVWVSNNRYFVDGIVYTISSNVYKNADVKKIHSLIEEYKSQNDYINFNKNIKTFISVNSGRFNYLIEESMEFIKSTSEDYPRENIVISFSGGKDSTVTADLVVRALSDPTLVHIFGDTTLEFPLTIEYAKRFKENNSKAIFKVAKNKDQNFYDICDDIGPPARMMRWCCSMFKTGPITRVLNNLYRDTNILTFYGIRKCESVSRSKYNRVEDDSESIKIQKQKVASPIFLWKDIDIWLYIFTENIDFNDAYRLGYDRVGCWCCPNNTGRAQFLASLYMKDEYAKWRSFLIGFAKKIGKPDPEVYIDTGKWKARQGGNGLIAAEDVKIKFTNCTAEENAKIYNLYKPMDDNFISMFIPFGIVSKELGRKIINEVIVLDLVTQVPIISIQPMIQNEYQYAVKIKTMSVKKHDDLHRMIGYQIKKYNACRKCLKCESLCKFGAITMNSEEYTINPSKCKRCKMCVSAKYLDGGCMMEKYLKTKQ